MLSVFRFDDDDEAVALANGTDYGLNASVHTTSLDRAHTMARRLEAGAVSVNGFQGASTAVVSRSRSAVSKAAASDARAARRVSPSS